MGHVSSCLPLANSHDESTSRTKEFCYANDNGDDTEDSCNFDRVTPYISRDFILEKCGPHFEYPPSPRLRRDRELREEESWSQR